MAKIIVKAPFYKPGHRTESGQSRGGYAHYIGTREGVEILRSGMAGYIGERRGSHGLFSDEGVDVSLSKISEEIDNHPGNVWGFIISLKREDAERVGYNSAEQWVNLLRSRRNVIAKEMGIAPSNLRWVAAYHNKETNPHVHMMVWSSRPQEPYLSREGIHNIKCNYPEKQILGDSQLETFLEAIKGHEYWCDFFYVEVMTGLRRGEICGLRWQDISFEENKLQVKRSVSVKKGGGVSIGETKTETGVRSILMPPSVADVLQNRKQRAITEWVFPNFMHPEQPISPATAYRKLKIILKHAGLPLIRFHDLRHTFATHATHGGVDPKTLAGILGHTNASFTLDTYTHVTNDMQKAASNIVGNIMQNIMIKE